MLSATNLFLVLASLAAPAVAWSDDPAPIYPTVQDVSLVAITTDYPLDRDSCGSVKWNDRVLWTCRDTQIHPNGTTEAFFSTSASYSALPVNATLPLEPVASNEPNGSAYPAADEQYGNNHNLSFYPLQDNQCNYNQGGVCDDNTRWVIWPNNQPALVTKPGEEPILGYTWIKNAHVANGLSLIDNDPSHSLYKVTSAPTDAGWDVLPTAELVNPEIYAKNEFNYGNWGSLVVDCTVYLYAQNFANWVALAKVDIEHIEDTSYYEYYVNGEWTTTRPAINDTAAILNCTAGGQGTFYYSDTWGQYVWIGQSSNNQAQFWVTTAPHPEGPWIEPQFVTDVPRGNGSNGAYTMQAHPWLNPKPDVNQIYVTYTIEYTNHYENPLYVIEWA